MQILLLSLQLWLRLTMKRFATLLHMVHYRCSLPDQQCNFHYHDKVVMTIHENDYYYESLTLIWNNKRPAWYGCSIYYEVFISLKLSLNWGWVAVIGSHGQTIINWILTTMFFMHHKHMQRLRPPLPDCEAYLKCLIEQCWQHAPEVFLIPNSLLKSTISV